MTDLCGQRRFRSDYVLELYIYILTYRECPDQSAWMRRQIRAFDVCIARKGHILVLRQLVFHILSIRKHMRLLKPRSAFTRSYIRKTYLYNIDPLKSHLYIVELGFTGVCIIFLVSAQNIDCGYSLEPPQRGGSNEYPQSMF